MIIRLTSGICAVQDEPYHSGHSGGVNHDFRCSICNTTFTSEAELLSHVESQSHKQRAAHEATHAAPATSWDCRLCHQRFADMAQLERHLTSVGHRIRQAAHSLSSSGALTANPGGLVVSLLEETKIMDGQVGEYRFNPVVNAGMNFARHNRG